MAMSKFVVGIFTREHHDMYQWLVRFLLSIFMVKDVRQVVISNNFSDFMQEAARCQFGIIYHSKRRGRLNVTDVTDSLYDNELQHLNQTYGKKKVLVVIDDLEDSSDDKKNEILQSQQSIQMLAGELFLFSTAEKSQLTDMMPAGYQNGSDLGNKLGRMRKMIEDTQYYCMSGADWNLSFMESSNITYFGAPEGPADQSNKGLLVSGQGSKTRRVRDERPDLETRQKSRQQRGSKWIIFGAIILVILILVIVLPITLS